MILHKHGRSSLGAAFAGGAFLLALYATVGCNSVLGIEPAELDEDWMTQPATVACDWPIAKPKTSCEENADESCASTCRINECLVDKSCRDALMLYRRCVGKDCDDTQGKCGGCDSESPKAREVFKCLTDHQCFIAGATSLCESYCECMTQRCPGSVPGGSLNSCKMVCSNGGLAPTGNNHYFELEPEPWKTFCLWEHCETGVGVDDVIHCPHARGMVDVCGTQPPDMPVGPVCEIRKGYGNAPCNFDDDCCSGECTSAKLCSDP